MTHLTWSHVCLCTIGLANIRYTHQNLVEIGDQNQTSVSSVFHYTHKIPDDIARPPGSPWIVIGSWRRRR